MKKFSFKPRGLYFIKDGEYKGAFVINITECNTASTKAILIFPDMTAIRVSNADIDLKLTTNTADFVESLPKSVYEVCLAQYKKSQKC